MLPCLFPAPCFYASLREVIMELLPHGHVEILPRRGGSIYTGETQKAAFRFTLWHTIPRKYIYMCKYIFSFAENCRGDAV